MSALAQRAGTKNLSINYNIGQKTREELASGFRIQIMFCIFGSSTKFSINSFFSELRRKEEGDKKENQMLTTISIFDV